MVSNTNLSIPAKFMMSVAFSNILTSRISLNLIYESIVKCGKRNIDLICLNEYLKVDGYAR